MIKYLIYYLLKYQFMTSFNIDTLFTILTYSRSILLPKRIFSVPSLQLSNTCFIQNSSASIWVKYSISFKCHLTQQHINILYGSSLLLWKLGESVTSKTTRTPFALLKKSTINKGMLSVKFGFFFKCGLNLPSPSTYSQYSYFLSGQNISLGLLYPKYEDQQCAVLHYCPVLVLISCWD